MVSRPIRRVVTTTDAAGRSTFLFDGPTQRIVELEEAGLTFHEVWSTTGPEASNDGQLDAAAQLDSLTPPIGGSIFRVVEFPPDSLRPPRADEELHRTETVDYNIILEGEIYAVSETGEVLLQPGDVLVTRGCAHGWRNVGPGLCLFASITVSARPGDEGL